MPCCTENKFHISESFDGVDECGNAHICLFKGRSFNNFTCVQRFPLLKDLGVGFGSCEVRDNVMNVLVTAYATVIHIAKRHGIINLKTSKNFADVRNLIFRLEEFNSVLSGSEKEQVGGYRLELLCEAASPLDWLAQFDSRVSRSFWVNSGALITKTVPVVVFLQSIRDALDFCHLLDLSRGANDRQLSKFRKFICTDLLNYFGICKPTMARYLGASGYSSHPLESGNIGLETRLHLRGGSVGNVSRLPGSLEQYYAASASVMLTRWLIHCKRYSNENWALHREAALLFG
jgi:hypothetical protein